VKVIYPEKFLRADILVHSAAYVMIAYAVFNGSQSASAKETVSTSIVSPALTAIDKIAPVEVKSDVEGFGAVIDRPDQKVLFGKSQHLFAEDLSKVIRF
jgi:hypothetical protein